MLKNIFLWILQNIFKINTETTQKEVEENQQFAKKYEDINSLNFNAIFSNKLSNYVANDSTFFIDGENARAELLNMTGQSMWKKIKKITAMAFGYGGVVIVPYVKGGKIYYNLIPQNRLTIDETTGDLITGATILAEKKTIKGTITETTYVRWTNYRIINNNLTITQQYTDKEGNKILAPEFWKDIQEVMSISNVDRVPFGYIKSPINNRKESDKYGVPITYGCESTINEIRLCLQQIADEYGSKEVKVFVDRSMLGKDNKMSNTNVIPTNGEDNFYQVFDSAIRDSSYYARLQQLFHQLEIEVGTSAGILTEIQTANATATAIRRAMFDTFSIVDATRSNIEDGLNDFFKACDILANAYNITAMGEYETNYNWDDSIRNDSQEEFTQYMQAVNKGAISIAELRNWIMPSEEMEESEQKVLEIKAQNPTIQDLLGAGNE